MNVLRGTEVVADFGVRVSSSTAARAVSLALGRFDLLSEDASTPLPAEQAHELIRVAEHHRILGVLAQAVEMGAVALTDDQLELLTERWRSWLWNVLKAERLLLDALECLSRADIEVRVLKGVHLAHGVYDDPSWRVFADVDLLVRSDQLDRAVELVSVDFAGERATAELRPGFDREFGKESMLRVRGMELDLHRTIVSGPFGLTIDLSELFDDPATIVVAGHAIPALGPRQQYLHACYNLAIGDYPMRLAAVRDLVLIDAAGRFSPNEVIETARRWRGTAVVQRAGAIMCQLLDDDPPSSWRQLSQLEPPKRESWALSTYLTDARAYRRQLASLLVIDGMRRRIAYASALVRPSPEYLTSRGWSMRHHVRRSLRRLTGAIDE